MTSTNIMPNTLINILTVIDVQTHSNNGKPISAFKDCADIFMCIKFLCVFSHAVKGVDLFLITNETLMSDKCGRNLISATPLPRILKTKTC